MTKKVVVPSKWFRENVRSIYERALAGAGVKSRNITVHIDSSATVNVKASDFDALMSVEGIVQLSDLSRLGNVTVLLPEAVDFLREHNPTEGTTAREPAFKLTPEQRAEREARRARRTELRTLLAELHGIAPDADAGEDFADDETL